MPNEISRRLNIIVVLPGLTTPCAIMGHLLCRIRHQENSHYFKEAVNCFHLGAILLRTACFHWAAPAGSSVLRKNSTAINKTNNKRIPVPDPGVPALLETDTSTPSPSTGHHFINRFNNKEKCNRKDQKQLRNSGTTTLFCRIGCCKMHPLCTETPWEKG
ncbi:hypothetical protein ACLKA6_006053 [Drosophila palustris]